MDKTLRVEDLYVCVKKYYLPDLDLSKNLSLSNLFGIALIHQSIFGGLFLYKLNLVSTKKMLDRFRFVGDFSCRLNPLRVTTRQEGVISWISLLRTHQSLSVWVASTAIGRHIKLSIVSVPIFVGVCGRVDLFVHWGHIFCLQSLEGIIAGRPLRRFTLGGRVGQIVAERVLTARLARMRPS